MVLTAVLALTWLARRLPASEPLFLLFGGVLLGLVPSFGEVRLSGEVVLLIFLPPLLYAEALNVSLYQIKANFRVIVLLAVGLVLVTLVTVAATAHAFGLAWAVAFVLGAILSPTDATAVALVARGMPRRFVAMCRRRAWSTTVPRWWPMPWPSTSRSAGVRSPGVTPSDATTRATAGEGPTPTDWSAPSTAKITSRSGSRPSTRESSTASGSPKPCVLLPGACSSLLMPMSSRCTTPACPGRARAASTTTASSVFSHMSIRRPGSPSHDARRTHGGRGCRAARERSPPITARPTASSRLHMLPTPMSMTRVRVFIPAPSGHPLRRPGRSRNRLAPRLVWMPQERGAPSARRHRVGAPSPAGVRLRPASIPALVLRRSLTRGRREMAASSRCPRAPACGSATCSGPPGRIGP